MRRILVKVKTVGEKRVRADIVYQSPAACRALPFTASNGVSFRTLPSGRPAAGLVNGSPTVFLRGEGCPLQNWNDPAIGEFQDALKAVVLIRAALTEFRETINALERELK